MAEWQERLENYLHNLPEKLGQPNAAIIRNYCEKYASLPSEPSEGRILTTITRLSTISKFLGNKPLDSLTENDFVQLNQKKINNKNYFPFSILFTFLSTNFSCLAALSKER